jgi:hypothetical protein
MHAGVAERLPLRGIQTLRCFVLVLSEAVLVIVIDVCTLAQLAIMSRAARLRHTKMVTYDRCNANRHTRRPGLAR